MPDVDEGMLPDEPPGMPFDVLTGILLWVTLGVALFVPDVGVPLGIAPPEGGVQPDGGFPPDGIFMPEGGPPDLALPCLSPGSAVSVGISVLLFISSATAGAAAMDGSMAETLLLQFVAGITGVSRVEAAVKVDWPKYTTSAIAINDKKILKMAKILVSSFIILPSSKNRSSCHF